MDARLDEGGDDVAKRGFRQDGAFRTRGEDEFGDRYGSWAGWEDLSAGIWYGLVYQESGCGAGADRLYRRATGHRSSAGSAWTGHPGLLPFTVKVRAEASDPEKGKITYEWDLGNGDEERDDDPELDYTYTNIGDYTISVVAKDDQGATAKSDSVSVYAGNSEPVVSIGLKGRE